MKKYLASVFFLLAVLSLNAQIPVPAGMSETQFRNAIVNKAKQYLGVTYVYGGQDPSGFDCTGIIYYVFQQLAGVTIPRSARHLAQYGTRITQAEAQPGDVYIFDTTGGPSHAGFYVGDGKLLHSASGSRTWGVVISDMSGNYYRTRFLYGRRIITPKPDDPTPQPVPEPEPDWPDRPLTGLDMHLEPRPLAYYDRIPFKSDTLVEFEFRNHVESGRYTWMFGPGDYQAGNMTIMESGTVSLGNEDVYLTQQMLIEGEQAWSFVVLDSDQEIRGLYVFRSQR